jgi:hypothetical protein
MTTKWFLQGNMTTLQNYYQKILNKEDINIAYFGGQLDNDILATNKFSALNSSIIWNTIYIGPEHEQINSLTQQNNYFLNQLQKESHYAIEKAN